MPMAGLAAVLLAAAGTLAAAPARYALDPVHTRVMFAVSHAGFSQALGTVSGSEGSLEFDPEDWSSARLDVRVPVQRLDLGDPDWNRATLARKLLDATRWPEARFVSERIEPLDAGGFIVHGQLSLRGVTAPLALEVRFNALRRHPMPPFRTTAGFSARGMLSRSAFGVDGWQSMIGDAVELRIEAEAVRSRGAQAPGTPEMPGTPDAPHAHAPPAAAPPPPVPDTAPEETSLP